MRKRLVAIAVWYFIFAPSGAVVTPLQVGPFATQAACDNFRMSIPFDGVASTCFSTTAKQ